MQTLVSRGRGVLERVTHDPVHALERVDFFLNGDLVVGPGLESAADADIDAFGVLAEHDEVDVLASAVLERATADRRAGEPAGN